MATYIEQTLPGICHKRTGAIRPLPTGTLEKRNSYSEDGQPTSEADLLLRPRNIRVYVFSGV